eukprot:TRINITY_DN37983_c0_g1_i1.p1 TRINITY_DN37983_c0_g1~~TRINITY_DN37983_c0_g1_i1.p1  ORF type:complete len:373 (+),score=69.25 TRINITY_DN37983_c0_g1_i1:100-1119(+)
MAAWGLLGSCASSAAAVPPAMILDASVHVPCTALLPDVIALALRHAPLLLLVFLHLSATGASAASGASSSGGAGADGAGAGGSGAGAGSSSAAGSAGGEEENALCSKALGFNESVGPKDRTGQDLAFCNEHHARTCCEKNHTKQAIAGFAAFSQEHSSRCVQMARLALCSVCDGDVGIGLKAQLNSIRLCPSFCQQWFQACREDFFAPSGSQALQPCVAGSLVCSPLGEITESAGEFCSRIGPFQVAETEDDGDSCFDGIPAARSRGKGPRAPWTRPVRPVDGSWLRWAQLKWERMARRYLAPGTRTRYFVERFEAYAPGIVVAMVMLLVGRYVLWRDD